MSAFPIADSAEAARDAGLPTARTQREAEALVRGPVYLAVEPLTARYATLAEAEAATPALYETPRFEAAFIDGAWRIQVRYWRPAPPAPVGRTATAALRRPLGRARTPEEARALLGGPAEIASEPLALAYASRAAVAARHRKLIEVGLARIVERAHSYHLEITYWRPLRSSGGALFPAERAEIAARLAQPLRGALPQSDPYVGLFETLAPENPLVILAEEGDGRTRGE
jgi:hypothetical protein